MKFGFGSSAEKNGIPHIERVAPAAAIPGGEITIHGRGFVSRAQARDDATPFGAPDGASPQQAELQRTLLASQLDEYRAKLANLDI